MGKKTDVKVIDELEAWFRAQPETPSWRACAKHSGLGVSSVQQYLRERGCSVPKGTRLGSHRERQSPLAKIHHCLYCGKEFAGGRRIYCSDQCASAGRREKYDDKRPADTVHIVHVPRCTVDDLDYFARDIRKGWDEGLSVKEIGDSIFRTPRLTSRWIKKNIPEATAMSRGDWIMRGQGKSRKGSPERKEATRLYVEEHLSAAEVGRRLNIDQQTARDWIRSEGVEIKYNYHDRMSEEDMAKIAARISTTKSQMDCSWTPQQRRKAEESWKIRKAQVREYRTCPVCGSEFYVRKSVKQECCSRSCMGTLRERRYIEENGFSRNQSHMPLKTIEILSTKENLSEYLGDRKVTTTELGDELECSCTVVLHRLKEFGMQDHILWGGSKEENQVGSLLQSWGIDWEKSRSVHGAVKVASLDTAVAGRTTCTKRKHYRVMCSNYEQI